MTCLTFTLPKRNVVWKGKMEEAGKLVLVNLCLSLPRNFVRDSNGRKLKVRDSEDAKRRLDTKRQQKPKNCIIRTN